MIVRTYQDNRDFGDNRIYVQFHDEAIPWLSTLSGSYFGCTISRADQSGLEVGETTSVGKIIYTRQPEKCDQKWKDEHAAFFYCDREGWVRKSWVFVAVFDGTLGEVQDPCGEWAMKSFAANPANTDEYDLATHSADLWFAKDSRNISDDGVLEGVQFLPSFFPTDTESANCKVLEATGATGIVFSFPFYERLPVVRISDRPVYFAGDCSNGEYVFYNGRRWVVVRQSDLALDCLAESGNSTLHAFCLKSFDPFTSNYTARLISNPMDLRTTGDSWIPTDELQWNKATGHGSSSRPYINRASLAVQIDKIPELLKTINRREATPEQFAEAEALFVQSATLTCSCHDKEECLADSCAAGEVNLWINLKTDKWPKENVFLVMGRDRWQSIQAESKSVYNIDDWIQTAEFASNHSVLNSTGFLPWQEVKSGTLENLEEYRYLTCVPENECGILYLQDTYGDGIFFPGGLDVYVDGKRIAIENETDVRYTLNHCVYQFGKSCNQSAQCSSDSFGFSAFDPQIDCPTESVPLAFEILPSDNQNRSILLSDLDYYWLRSLPRDLEVGFFDWQPMYKLVHNSSKTFRYSTCVPSNVCASLDTQNFTDSLRVIYNETVIDLSNETVIDLALNQSSSVNSTYCFYKLGPACETEIICDESKIVEVPSNPTLDCPGGKSLAINFRPGDYPAESMVVVTDRESLRQRLWLDASAGLNETGYFDWGLFQIDLNPRQQPRWYNTCVPRDVCGVVALIDNSRRLDGLFGGGISVFYDQEEIPIRNAENVSSSCLQFGVSCGEEESCNYGDFISWGGDDSAAPTFSPIV